MSHTTLSMLWRIGSGLQAVSMAIVACLTVFLGVTLGLALAGLIPGLAVTLSLSDGSYYAAGPLVHGVAFLISLILLSYMPANWRMRRLEAGHRSFRVGMEDVARAYQVAHAADRAGMFGMPSEYDAVRERLEFLVDHPDLGHLEPDIMELAAQMSRVSEDLAKTFSDEGVARAQAFLSARQQDISRSEDRIERALEISRELKQWHDRLSIEEDIAQSRVDQIKAELEDLLPQLDVASGTDTDAPGVVRLPPRTVAAE